MPRNDYARRRETATIVSVREEGWRVTVRDGVLHIRGHNIELVRHTLLEREGSHGHFCSFVYSSVPITHTPKVLSRTHLNNRHTVRSNIDLAAWLGLATVPPFKRCLVVPTEVMIRISTRGMLIRVQLARCVYVRRPTRFNNVQREVKTRSG